MLFRSSCSPPPPARVSCVSEAACLQGVALSALLCVQTVLWRLCMGGARAGPGAGAGFGAGAGGAVHARRPARPRRGGCRSRRWALRVSLWLCLALGWELRLYWCVTPELGTCVMVSGCCGSRSSARSQTALSGLGPAPSAGLWIVSSPPRPAHNFFFFLRTCRAGGTRKAVRGGGKAGSLGRQSGRELAPPERVGHSQRRLSQGSCH